MGDGLLQLSDSVDQITVDFSNLRSLRSRGRSRGRDRLRSRLRSSSLVVGLFDVVNLLGVVVMVNMLDFVGVVGLMSMVMSLMSGMVLLDTFLLVSLSKAGSHCQSNQDKLDNHFVHFGDYKFRYG